ncbi:hypothetical protein ES703_79719 [subsurface metagenome]
MLYVSRRVEVIADSDTPQSESSEVVSVVWAVIMMGGDSASTAYVRFFLPSLTYVILTVSPGLNVVIISLNVSISFVALLFMTAMTSPL